MAQSIAEALIAEGEARGRLKALRTLLLMLLRKRFKELPDDLVRRVEASDDANRLDDYIFQVFDLKSVDEIDL